MAETLKIEGFDWIDELSAEEIAKVLLAIEKYHEERVTLGDDKAELNLKVKLNQYVKE